MTREEATAYWKQRSEHIHNWLEENEDVDFIGEYVEAIDMAIEALQAEPTHGRLIDADTLSKKLCGTTIFIKDGEVFQRMINDAPTVQADRPHGEWVEREDWNGDSCYDAMALRA